MRPSLDRNSLEMEQKKEKKKKRGREGEELKDSTVKTTKRQDLGGHCIGNIINIEESNHEDNKDNSNSSSSSSSSIYELSDDSLALGVFDFPWLKEGMISNSEECFFEDTFSSCLHDTYYTTVAAEFSGQCLCESPATCMASSSIDIPVDKFEENLWSMEMDGVDCTWSSLLTHPLQREGA